MKNTLQDEDKALLWIGFIGGCFFAIIINLLIWIVQAKLGA